MGKIADKIQAIEIKLALLDDETTDLAKAVIKIERSVSDQREKSTHMLICILTCTAAIIAAILQGVLTSGGWE